VFEVDVKFACGWQIRSGAKTNVTLANSRPIKGASTNCGRLGPVLIRV
jgi:hypothetical protein